MGAKQIGTSTIECITTHREQPAFERNRKNVNFFSSQSREWNAKFSIRLRKCRTLDDVSQSSYSRSVTRQKRSRASPRFSSLRGARPRGNFTRQIKDVTVAAEENEERIPRLPFHLAEKCLSSTDPKA